MWNSKLFKAEVAILLLFLIILVGSYITFIFQPIIIAFEVLFLSIIISGALYYIMLPLVDLLSTKKIPRSVSVAISLLIFIALLTLIVALIGPGLQEEFVTLIESAPQKINQLQDLIESFKETPILSQLFALETFYVENINEMIPRLVQSALVSATSSVAIVIDYTTSIFITIIIVPFLLYYMLNEKGKGHVPAQVEKVVPPQYAETIKEALAEIDRQLASYVQGLCLVCLVIGILSYIGFLIIGIDYALVLAIFVMITNVVPIIGPFIGAIPAALVGLLHSPLMMLWAIAVILVIQQIDSIVARPMIVGRKMAMSPLAVIIVVLLAGRLWGLAGIILAVPIFTVLKITVGLIYQFIKGSDVEAKEQPD